MVKMRRKQVVVAISTFPFVNGLSLTNFQEISSALIPIPCALAYSSQIAICTVDDFNKGCSDQCKRALNQKATEVTDACFGLIVNSRSLLGIVQAGGIVQALCLKDDAGETTTTRRTSASIQTTRSVPPQATLQTPIQTTTPRLVAPSTFTFPTVSSPLPVSTVPTIEPTSTAIIVAPTTTLRPGNGGIGDPPRSSTTSARPTTTTRAAAGGSSGGGGGGSNDSSGGGSPFDIVSSGNQHERSSLIGALAVAGWAFILFRW